MSYHFCWWMLKPKTHSQFRHHAQPVEILLTNNSNLYTYKSLVVLLAWLIEAVRRFDNSRVHSTCYESWSNYSSASNSTLRSNDSIFSLGKLREKLSHFDIKSWVKFLFRQWLNFLGQNDSILSLGALRKKLSHFDFKN